MHDENGIFVDWTCLLIGTNCKSEWVYERFSWNRSVAPFIIWNFPSRLPHTISGENLRLLESFSLDFEHLLKNFKKIKFSCECVYCPNLHRLHWRRFQCYISDFLCPAAMLSFLFGRERWWDRYLCWEEEDSRVSWIIDPFTEQQTLLCKKCS